MDDNALITAYYKLIKAGVRTIDTILPQFKVAVQALLDADNA